MGGDLGPHVTVPATLDALRHHSKLTAKLVGQHDLIMPFLTYVTKDVSSRIEIIHASDTVSMSAKPAQTLRKSQESSIYKALQQVAENNASACVTAGNTGALMVLSRHILHTLAGIDRPAIITAIPTLEGHCHMLDLGANIESSAEQLLQFAIMGSAMVSAVDAIASPRVGLLNIGEEETKGTEQIKQASRMIAEQTDLNYIGYVEADGLYSGRADVVVCDGFVGNIALKSSEGLAHFISRKVRASFNQSAYRRLLALISRPILTELEKQMDPSRRNGAYLLGLQGMVIKSHGHADKACFGYALEQAINAVEQNIPARISKEIESKIMV